MRCCIIMPVGPGHEDISKQATNSVLQAFEFDRGPFDDVVFIDLDDTKGRNGRSKMRNQGIAWAIEQNIEWLFFLDADDLMHTKAFQFFQESRGDNDAVWGAITELQENGEGIIRQGQPSKLTCVNELIQHDPFVTLQMGHFVKTEVAVKVLFDENMDCGEDFKYYLSLWKSYKCVKINNTLFLNRRGMHSTGPRSANGGDWRKAVEAQILAFRVENSDLLMANNGPEEPHHVVVLGYPYSGISMLYNMLRSTVKNFGTFDTELSAKLIANANNITLADVPNLITKHPLDVFDVPGIIESNKNKRKVSIIVLISDIRSIITSIHKGVPDDYFISFDHQYFVSGDQKPTLTNPGILQTHNAISRLSKGIAGVNVITLRYEDILAKAGEVQEALAKILGFTYSGYFTNFLQHIIPDQRQPALGGEDPLEEKPISSWRDEKHKERIYDQFSTCPDLFAILKAYGYEKNDDWFLPYKEHADHMASLEGKPRKTIKVGRNEPCPCMSGMKYKKCCGASRA